MPNIIFVRLCEFCSFAAFSVTYLSLHSLSLHRDSKLDLSLPIMLTPSPLSAVGKAAIKAPASARRAPWLLLSPTASQRETTVQPWATHRVQPTVCRLQVY